MSYRNLSRTDITLPSGAKTSIRKLKVVDYLDEKGIPVLPFGQKAKEESEHQQFVSGVLFTRRILSCCVDSLRYENETLRIVNKPSMDCRQGELSIDDLTQDDADFIVSEVTKLMGLTVKAAEAVAPFPEQQSSGGSAAPAG